MPEEAAMKIAGDGWILLSKYYNEVYSKHTEQVVGVNFDFSLQVEGIDFRAHTDVISVDPAGQVTILEFGDKKSRWQVYVSLKTKLELCALADSLGAWPAKTRYFNLSHSKTSYSEHLVEFDQHYKDTAAGTITGVARMLKSGAIYCVPNEQCSSCPYQGKCWV
jgi:RecB family exonuclease